MDETETFDVSKSKATSGYNTIAASNNLGSMVTNRNEQDGLDPCPIGGVTTVSNDKCTEQMKQVDVDSDRNQKDATLPNSQTHEHDELTIQWQVLLIIVSIYTGMFSVGFGFSLSVLFAELVRVFNAKRAIVAMVQSLNVGFVIGSTIVWSYPIQRFGTGRCILLASIVCSFAITISASSVNIGMVICLIGIITGLFGSVLNLGPYFIINKLFEKRRKLALSFLPCGAGLGQIVISYSLEILIDNYGWRGALLIIGGLAMNTVPCCLLLHVKNASIDGSRDNANDIKLFQPTLFTQRRFVLLMVAALTFAIFVLPEDMFLVDLMVMKGFDFETGSMFASLIGVTNLIGRCIGTGINAIDKGKGCLYFACFILIAAVAHMFVLLSGNYYGILVGALLSGLAYGLCVSQIVVTILDLFPLELFPAVLTMFHMAGLGFTFGGYIGGTVSDMTGSYDLFFEMSTAGCMLTFLCMIILYLSLVVEKRQNEYESL